jgi:hypothetical protein
MLALWYELNIDIIMELDPYLSMHLYRQDRSVVFLPRLRESVQQGLCKSLGGVRLMGSIISGSLWMFPK